MGGNLHIVLLNKKCLINKIKIYEKKYYLHIMWFVYL